MASVSLGSETDPGSQVKAAFDNANAAGIVVVACAGNSGSGSDTVWWPAKYDSVIAVAATTSSDSRSSFSSTGPSVELAAPGSSILSTFPGESYANMNGTSMACPHVSGVAALLISAGVADANGNGKINDEIRAVLQATANDLGTAGRDEQFGHGLIDAPAAVAAVYGSSGDSGDSEVPEPEEVFDSATNLFGTVSGSVINLSWEDNSNVEDGYEIWEGIKVKKNTTWSLVQTTGPDTTTAEIPGLADGKYIYQVRAVRGELSTGFSNQIQLTVGERGGGGGGKRRK